MQEGAEGAETPPSQEVWKSLNQQSRFSHSSQTSKSITCWSTRTLYLKSIMPDLLYWEHRHVPRSVLLKIFPGMSKGLDKDKKIPEMNKQLSRIMLTANNCYPELTEYVED